MVEMEQKWLGVVNKCLDSDELATPNNLGLGSFWGLFLIAGVAAVIVLIIHMCRSLFCAPASPVVTPATPDAGVAAMIVLIICVCRDLFNAPTAPAAVREDVDAANEGGN